MLPLLPGICFGSPKFFRIVKSRILKNYGVTGIEVTLNIADQMVLTHTVDRINAYIDDFEKHGEINRGVMDDLFTINMFLKKLVLKDAVKPTIFEEEKEEEAE